MKYTTKEEIRKVISNCVTMITMDYNGNLEISRKDCEQILNDIERIVDSEQSFRDDYRNYKRNTLKGDMEW